VGTMNAPDRLDAIVVPDEIPKYVFAWVVDALESGGRLVRVCLTRVCNLCARGAAGSRTSATRKSRMPQPSRSSGRTTLLGTCCASACVTRARVCPPADTHTRCSCSQLLRDEKVKFAGYQHPHPLENDILVKIQASTNPSHKATPLSVFRTAVTALTEEIDHVFDSFQVRHCAFVGGCLMWRPFESGGGTNMCALMFVVCPCMFVSSHWLVACVCADSSETHPC